MKISINLENAVSDKLGGLIATLEGRQFVEITRRGGEAALVAATQYHRDFNAAGGWRGKRYMGGGSDPGKFGSEITDAWFLGDVDESGATLANAHPHFALKVHGGTIVPKRADALTIPLIADAKGKAVREYTRETGRKLFTLPGVNILFEKGESVAVKGWRGGKSKRQPLRAVYALVKSVTHQPWKGAMPPEEILSDAFLQGWKNGLADEIESI